MAYRVVITSQAKYQLDEYIKYTLTFFKNVQAARGIRDDANGTKRRLSNVAGCLPLCEDDILAKYGYRRIRFEKHDFFMVYRIDGEIVIVDAMYHELQDYTSIFAKKMHLK